MNPLIDLMTTRRSIRRYQPEAPAPEAIEQLLTAAIWAPSAHNRQPWRFAVVLDPEAKRRLATAMAGRLRTDLLSDGAPPEAIAADVGRSIERISQAPALIVVCLTMVDMDVYPDERRQQNERTMAVQSAAMAGQNLLLAAHALGLGACWLCGPLFCPDVVRDALALPDDWEPQGAVTVGFPAEERIKTRRPLDSFLVRR